MDPLSITASVASLLSFSAACGTHLHKIIHNLRHAPDEILALSNEITDLNLILADLEATCQSIESSDSPPTQSRAEFNGALTTQLINARSKLIQLNSLGTSLLVSMPDGRTKFRKYTWVRKKSFVVALRRDLVDVKRNIGILLASTTA
jgi:hypothetical protein